MPSSTPYFSMAASVSPPPASENALLRAMALAMARVPSPNCSNSNTPTGPFQMMVAADSSSWLALGLQRQRAFVLGAQLRVDVGDQPLDTHLQARRVVDLDHRLPRRRRHQRAVDADGDLAA